MSSPRDLIVDVEENLEMLADVFVTNNNDYFFTEKELHAYFYHLSMLSSIFQHRGHYLIHTEYPSPFKCSYINDKPYIRHEPINSKTQRSHFDCVLVNPRFVDWLLDNNRGIKELIGIGNKRFDLYIKNFYDAYAHFNEETGEPILLYALEFKFLRHSYGGQKYPIREIHQDIAKLRLLRKFGEGLPDKINFVARTKLVIFIGERTQKAGEAIRREIERYNAEEYNIIVRKSLEAAPSDHRKIRLQVSPDVESVRNKKNLGSGNRNIVVVTEDKVRI
jgi:hypothetical protein